MNRKHYAVRYTPELLDALDGATQALRDEFYLAIASQFEVDPTGNVVKPILGTSNLPIFENPNPKREGEYFFFFASEPFVLRYTIDGQDVTLHELLPSADSEPLA